MKNRKIIIATDAGIIREYITDGVSGILVEGNRKAMAIAIRAVNANIDRFRSYGHGAYERYEEFFSGEAIARRLDEMMNQHTLGQEGPQAAHLRGVETTIVNFCTRNY